MNTQEKINNAAVNLEACLREVFERLRPEEISPVLQEARERADALLMKLGELLANGKIKSIITISRALTSESLFIALSLRRESRADVVEIAKKLEIRSRRLLLAAEGTPLSERVTMDGGVREESRDQITAQDILEEVKFYSAEAVSGHDRLKRQLAESEVRLAELELKVKGLDDEAQKEINKIVQSYNDALVVVEGKKSEINDVLGHLSGRAVAGDYDKSAAEEKIMADWLRYGALLCMLLIILVLFGAVLSTVDDVFDWNRFLSRISLVFLLSVPAAYLARESSKHRGQQYQHLQTSLDMKAVSPFLASLPEEERHKIKSAIASRIFGGKDFTSVSGESFPINAHQIIMEIIKKLEVPGVSGKGAPKSG